MDARRAVKKFLLAKLRRIFRIKKSAKKGGYAKLVSDEEQRILEEYTNRVRRLPNALGMPYYDY